MKKSGIGLSNTSCGGSFSKDDAIEAEDAIRLSRPETHDASEKRLILVVPPENEVCIETNEAI